MKKSSRLLAVLLTLVMVFGMLPLTALAEAGSASTQAKDILDSLSANSEFTDSSLDWRVMDMAAYGKTESLTNLNAFYSTAMDTAKGDGGVTHWQRVAISLTSVGFDVTQLDDGVGGTINLIDEIANRTSLGTVNGYIFALIAYDCGNYEVHSGWTRDALIDYLINTAQISTGGWQLSASGTKADPDMTAMAICALAPYYSQEQVQTAVDKAVTWLSEQYQANGGFIPVAGVKVPNTDSTSQVIIALSALGINAHADERFVNNGVSVLEHLLTFKLSDDRFGCTDSTTYNSSSTEQAFRALLSYYCFLQSEEPYNSYLSKDNGVEPLVEAELNKMVLSYAKSNLNSKMTAAQAIVPASEADYTPESYRALSAALANAETAYSGGDKDAIYAAYQALTAALDGLVQQIFNLDIEVDIENIKSIADRLAGMSEFTSATNATGILYVADMAAYGKKDALNRDTIYTSALSDAKTNADALPPGAASQKDTNITNTAQLALTLTSLGYDATALDDSEGGTIDLINTLAKFYYLSSGNQAYATRLEGYAYTLLAYDSGAYELTEDAVWTRDKMIALIFTLQNTDGGFRKTTTSAYSYIGETCIAISALAPYRDRADVAAVIDKAVDYLSGQYIGGKVETCAYAANMIVALSALGIDAGRDMRFVKDDVSLLDELLSYQITDTEDENCGKFMNAMFDDEIIYTPAANEMAFRALVAYYNFTELGSSYNIYSFTSDKTALASAIDKAEAYDSSKYTAASYRTLQTALIDAKAVYAESAARQIDVNNACAALESAIKNLKLDTSNPSNPTVTVTFSLYGVPKAADPDNYTPTYIYKNNSGSFEKWISSEKYTFEGSSVLVYDVFVEALSKNGFTAEYNTNDNYVAGINGPSGWLREFDNGPLSGWMYTVNGAYATLGLSEKYVEDGDVIVWHYTDDHTQEKASETWSGSSSPGSTVEPDTNLTVDVIPTISGGKATSTVSDTQITVALKKTLETLTDKGTGATGEVKLRIDTKTATSAATEISANALKTVAAESNVVLTIETGVGTMTFDSAALEKISGGSTDNNAAVEITIRDVTGKLTGDSKNIVGDNPVFELTVTVDGNKITDFGSGKVTVVLPYTPQTDEDTSKLTVCYLDDNGNVIEMDGAKYDAALGGFVFTTNHFSLFFIAAAAEWTNPFADVKEANWFYDAVKYANENGLMYGTSDTLFSPNDPMTRAMLVTVLYRYEGEPAVTAANPFSDAASGQWYTDAIIWASENGIVSGYGGGLFGTNDYITREQIAAILYRYAQMKGLSVSKTAELSSYTDAAQVSDYAQNAIKWAVAEGIIAGRTTTTIVPGGTASRAEVATMLMRFSEAFVN